jgi:anaerobic selenocysteine-containing dehydrogenase
LKIRRWNFTASSSHLRETHQAEQDGSPEIPHEAGSNSFPKFAAYGYPAMPEYVEPALSPVSKPEIAADFPLVLTNAKITSFVHSQQRALTSLRKSAPEPSADIHPETAVKYGIKNKGWMIVETPKGAIKVKAHVTPNIINGIVCVQHGWWQACKELEPPRLRLL